MVSVCCMGLDVSRNSLVRNQNDKSWEIDLQQITDYSTGPSLMINSATLCKLKKEGIKAEVKCKTKIR